MPKPDVFAPEKGIQSTLKAVWSLTMTVVALSRLVALRVVLMSLLKMAD